MKMILLGAPGAGKGTQGEMICERYGIPEISTGAILREAIGAGTPLGQKAAAIIEHGGLVPDEVVNGIVEERLKQEDCREGFILDGYPRTLPQARALDENGVGIDRVLSIEISDREIEERMSGRRVCGKCGAPYHVKAKPPKREGVCDLCGGALVHRDDDKPETVRHRLEVYHRETEPLKDYYQGKGILVPVDNQDTIEGTTQVIMEALQI